MAVEFCSHLSSYSHQYESATVAYEDCLVLIDRALATGAENTLVTQLQDTLNRWEWQTRELRQKFKRLNERGEILLPQEGQNTQPVCAHCGAEVPRLEFAEFQFREDGSVLFRDQLIQAPEDELV